MAITAAASEATRFVGESDGFGSVPAGCGDHGVDVPDRCRESGWPGAPFATLIPQRPRACFGLPRFGGGFLREGEELHGRRFASVLG